MKYESQEEIKKILIQLTQQKLVQRIYILSDIFLARKYSHLKLFGK